MSSASLNRQIGSVFMIIGTEIGAGVLALPILIVHVGVFVGALILIFAWAVMLYTALLICEASDAIEGDISFATMAKQFLGKWGKFFITIVFWCTLSSIAMAFISAAGSIFNEIIKVSSGLASTIFVVVFGCCVMIGTSAVDYVNRTILSIKLLVFIFAILFLFGTLKVENLSISGQFGIIIASFPAIFVSFVLHNIIPSIRTYLNYDKRALRKVVIIGSMIPLVLYILWTCAIIGNIPPHGPNSFDILISQGSKANVGDLLNLVALNNNKLIVILINFVAGISVTTSFLGCSISLYHFSRDIFGHERKNFITFHAIPMLLTFVVPLLIVITYPNIFIIALGYAGEGSIILFVLIPILIIRKLIKGGHKFSWSIMRNPIMLTLAFLIGLSIIFIKIFSNNQ